MWIRGEILSSRFHSARPNQIYWVVREHDLCTLVVVQAMLPDEWLMRGRFTVGRERYCRQEIKVSRPASIVGSSSHTAADLSVHVGPNSLSIHWLSDLSCAL